MSTDKANDQKKAQEKEKRYRLIAMIIISVVGFAFVLVHLVRPTLAIDTITVVLLVIAAIPWLSEFISSAALPGGWRLTFVQRRQEEQAEQIATLQFLVTHLLTEDQINHLTQLDKSTPYNIEKPVSPELQPDLRHLRGLGFIEGKGKTVAELGKELDNKGKVAASDYFCITDIGRTYLKLRRQYV